MDTDGEESRDRKHQDNQPEEKLMDANEQGEKRQGKQHDKQPQEEHMDTNEQGEKR